MSLSTKESGDQSVHDETDPIIVAIRIRPMSESEAEHEKPAADAAGIPFSPHGTWAHTNDSIVDTSDISTGGNKMWLFDRVFGSDASNSTVYSKIARPLIKSALNGVNATIFAYGQTGSGKTHTMLGTNTDPGILPRAVHDLFKFASGKTADGRTQLKKSVTLRASYLEIYNEEIHDLNTIGTRVAGTNGIPRPNREAPSTPNSGFRSPSMGGERGGSTGYNLRILHDDPIRGAYVEGLSEVEVRTKEDVLELISRGESVRHYGATNVHAGSSRSHSLFRLIIEQDSDLDPELKKKLQESNAISAKQGNTGGKVTSVLCLVDLAGSERQDLAGTRGERLREGGAINRSLSALSHVISKLASQAEKGKAKDRLSSEAADSGSGHGFSTETPGVAQSLSRTSSLSDVVSMPPPSPASGSSAPSGYINFRNSKLTRLLRQSLGGNAKTVIIANLSPSWQSRQESISTLSFAWACKKVKNKVAINFIPDEIPTESYELSDQSAYAGTHVSTHPGFSRRLPSVPRFPKSGAVMATPQHSMSPFASPRFRPNDPIPEEAKARIQELQMEVKSALQSRESAKNVARAALELLRTAKQAAQDLDASPSTADKIGTLLQALSPSRDLSHFGLASPKLSLFNQPGPSFPAATDEIILKEMKLLLQNDKGRSRSVGSVDYSRSSTKNIESVIDNYFSSNNAPTTPSSKTPVRKLSSAFNSAKKDAAIKSRIFGGRRQAAAKKLPPTGGSTSNLASSTSDANNVGSFDATTSPKRGASSHLGSPGFSVTNASGSRGRSLPPFGAFASSTNLRSREDIVEQLMQLQQDNQELTRQLTEYKKEFGTDVERLELVQEIAERACDSDTELLAEIIADQCLSPTEKALKTEYVNRTNTEEALVNEYGIRVQAERCATEERAKNVRMEKRVEELEILVNSLRQQYANEKELQRATQKALDKSQNALELMEKELNAEHETRKKLSGDLRAEQEKGSISQLALEYTLQGLRIRDFEEEILPVITSLYRTNGKEGAASYLQGLVENHSASDTVSANTALAEALAREKKANEEAMTSIREKVATVEMELKVYRDMFERANIEATSAKATIELLESKIEEQRVTIEKYQEGMSKDVELMQLESILTEQKVLLEKKEKCVVVEEERIKRELEHLKATEDLIKRREDILEKKVQRLQEREEGIAKFEAEQLALMLQNRWRRLQAKKLKLRLDSIDEKSKFLRSKEEELRRLELSLANERRELESLRSELTVQAGNADGEMSKLTKEVARLEASRKEVETQKVRIESQTELLHKKLEELNTLRENLEEREKELLARESLIQEDEKMRPIRLEEERLALEAALRKDREDLNARAKQVLEMEKDMGAMRAALEEQQKKLEAGLQGITAREAVVASRWSEIQTATQAFEAKQKSMESSLSAQALLLDTRAKGINEAQEMLAKRQSVFEQSLLKKKELAEAELRAMEETSIQRIRQQEDGISERVLAREQAVEKAEIALTQRESALVKREADLVAAERDLLARQKEAEIKAADAANLALKFQVEAEKRLRELIEKETTLESKLKEMYPESFRVYEVEQREVRVAQQEKDFEKHEEVMKKRSEVLDKLHFSLKNRLDELQTLISQLSNRELAITDKEGALSVWEKRLEEWNTTLQANISGSPSDAMMFSSAASTASIADDHSIVASEAHSLMSGNLAAAYQSIEKKELELHEWEKKIAEEKERLSTLQQREKELNAWEKELSALRMRQESFSVEVEKKTFELKTLEEEFSKKLAFLQDKEQSLEQAARQIEENESDYEVRLRHLREQEIAYTELQKALTERELELRSPEKRNDSRQDMFAKSMRQLEFSDQTVSRGEYNALQKEVEALKAKNNAIAAESERRASLVTELTDRAGNLAKILLILRESKLITPQHIQDAMNKASIASGDTKTAASQPTFGTPSAQRSSLSSSVTDPSSLHQSTASLQPMTISQLGESRARHNLTATVFDVEQYVTPGPPPSLGGNSRNAGAPANFANSSKSINAFPFQQPPRLNGA